MLHLRAVDSADKGMSKKKHAGGSDKAAIIRRAARKNGLQKLEKVAWGLLTLAAGTALFRADITKIFAISVLLLAMAKLVAELRKW